MPQLRKPTCRFVIFAQGRSGSTLLTDLLDSSPEVTCEGEVLYANRRHPGAYVLARGQGRGPVYGFKVKPYQLTEQQGVDPGAFLQELHTAGWKVVHLKRRNVVSQALSTMIAHHRGGVWHKFSESSGLQNLSIDIDPAELLRQVQGRADCLLAEDAALIDVPHLSVVYEDDLLHSEAHQATADRIFSFLGAPTATIATRHQRLADGVVPSFVKNRDELYRVLADSQWAPLLDDV